MDPEGPQNAQFDNFPPELKTSNPSPILAPPELNISFRDFPEATHCLFFEPPFASKYQRGSIKPPETPDPEVLALPRSPAVKPRASRAHPNKNTTPTETRREFTRSSQRRGWVDGTYPQGSKSLKLDLWASMCPLGVSLDPRITKMVSRVPKMESQGLQNDSFGCQK